MARRMQSAICLTRKNCKRNFSSVPLGSQPFLNGTSSAYLEDMYNLWLKDPKSVHASWDSFFRHSAEGGVGYQSPPLITPTAIQVPRTAPTGLVSSGATVSEKMINDHFVVQNVIRNYQTRGHLIAQLDPLGIYRQNSENHHEPPSGVPPEILRQHSIELIDMHQPFTLPRTTFIGGNEKALPFKEIIRRLHNAYCRSIGAEYMFINDMNQLQFIRERLEKPGCCDITKEQKRILFGRLCRARGFEDFLAKKWASEKRFGIEGCESMIPCLKQIIDVSVASGVESFVLGMPHRGRLNVLANICRRPISSIFVHFIKLGSADESTGDVKYHLGVSVNKVNRATGKQIQIAVCANASHLESVNPVVEGKVRAEQHYRGDLEGKQVMPILLHGDAAFCGQGVVYETMHLSALPCYRTGGTIHVVCNNQVGFTTDPRFHRSSPYCTDVARVVNAPIFHVNADDPEAVMIVSTIAAQWRATYHTDVVIDLVGYRKMGHNEADEPMFTQPLMYKKIRTMKPVNQKYAEKLMKEGVISKAESNESQERYEKICEEEFAMASKEKAIKYADWLDSPWSGFFSGKDPMKIEKTGVKEEILKHIALVFSSPPPQSAKFAIHKGLERILGGRMKMVEARESDWAIGEALTFGTLLKDGVHVRLSGQDVERGTFSHRHHVLHHQEVDNSTYEPLKHLYPDQAPYTVCNSSLSEYALLGFELGYSMTYPNALVVWEGQFGDFANTAQCIIDQYIASGQAKWVRQSGLVLLLPHGLEGMGPEHSSARLERFLQLAGDDESVIPEVNENFVAKQLYDTNMIVANCTNPANYFHMMRRQMKMPFRKPLIMMTPKSLLRHPEAKSNFDDYLEGTEAKRIIPETGPAFQSPQDVKKLLFCSGKVFYDVRQARDQAKHTNQIAIVRIEQLNPFPFDLVRSECEKYESAELCWVQEEHKNSGAWSFIMPRFNTLLEGHRSIRYIGRPPHASPATGNSQIHKAELAVFLNAAVSISSTTDN